MIWRDKIAKGYTLIEMVVVVGIIVMLTVLAMPQVNGIEEESNLAAAADTVRQAIIDARNRSMAPKSGDDEAKYSTYKLVFTSGISGETVLNSTNYWPIQLYGITTDCEQVESKPEPIKKVDLPEGITIDSFSPSDMQEPIGTTDKYIASVSYTLDNFNVTCSNMDTDADEWDDSQVFQIKLKNKKYDQLKKSSSGSTQPEFMYINVNKYSGQVWATSDEDGIGNIVRLPKLAPAGDIKDDYSLQDTYVGFGSNGAQIDIRVGTDNLKHTYGGFIMFRLTGLTEEKFPKKARLWLTTTNATQSGSVEIYLQNPDDYSSYLNSSFETSLTLTGSTQYEGKTLSGLKSNNRYAVEFNIAKYNSWWKKDDGTYDFSKPLVLYLKNTSPTSLAYFYSKEWLKNNGSVAIKDEEGKTGAESSLMVRPGPFVELIY